MDGGVYRNEDFYIKPELLPPACFHVLVTCLGHVQTSSILAPGSVLIVARTQLSAEQKRAHCRRRQIIGKDYRDDMFADVRGGDFSMHSAYLIPPIL